MPKATETTLEINLAALAHNFNYLKSKIKEATKFLAVVKAFAYGSDATKVASKLEQLGVDYLAVAYTQEGVTLRKAGISTPILVLHPQPSSFDVLLKHCLEPSLYSPRIMRLFLEKMASHKIKNYPIHLKFNTGLNRLGFWENDIDFITSQLKGRSDIKVISVFSHLAASEDANEKDFTQQQLSSFKKIIQNIDAALPNKPIKHILNTSGIINYASEQLDMVRSGIGLYGFGNDVKIDKDLKPIATLKTIISQIHKIEPHESVGYNRAYTSDGYRKTATLPIGHADGISRQYGNNNTTYVYINNQKAPIIGNVCMDMIMIDVSEIDCKEGDEVIIFDGTHNAAEFAASANTISYEILTSISQRVKRSYIDA